MSRRIKVSVLITTYNQKNFISDALESAVNQICDFPFEVVVGEDCSTDGTREIVQEYAKRFPNLIRPLFSNPRLGPNRNFARTFQECSGEFIAVLDGDDYWTDRRKLSKQIEYMERNPKFSISFHPVQVRSLEGKILRIHPPKRWRRECHWDRFLAVDFTPFSSIVYRASKPFKFPEIFFRFRCAGWGLSLMHAHPNGVGFLPDTMGVYRLHSGSLWASRPLYTRVLECRRFLKAYRALNPTLRERNVYLRVYDQLNYFVRKAVGNA